MKLFNNKFFVLGILGLIIASIPLTIYFISQQQQVRTNAEAATTLSFTPNAITDVNVGDEVTLDVSVDPGGVNVVSIIRLQIKYDPTKLELINIEPENPPFTVILEGLTASNGDASISFGIGADVTQAVQTQTTAAKVTFKALATTEQPTLVSFETATAGLQTQVLSLSSTDNPGENVLSAANPASITILDGEGEPTTSPTPSVGISPTTAPVTPVANQAPVCNSLGVDRSTTGTAPYALTFTATGSDPDGTISKVTYNFGDGPVQDVTEGNGIGTNAVSAPLSHTYNNAGTYTVSATLTDEDGSTSSGATCTSTVTVTAADSGNGGNGGNGGNNGGNTTQPTPTIADPGATATTVGIIAGLLIAVVGGVLLFAL